MTALQDYFEVVGDVRGNDSGHGVCQSKKVGKGCESTVLPPEGIVPPLSTSVSDVLRENPVTYIWTPTSGPHISDHSQSNYQPLPPF